MLATVAGVVFVTFVVFSVGMAFQHAHGHDEPNILKAMKHDPMATYLPREALERPEVLEVDAGFALNTPTLGMYERTFLVRRRDGLVALDRAVKAARAAGWTFEPDETTATERRHVDGYRSAEKQRRRAPYFSFNLTINLSSQTDLDAGASANSQLRELHITLRGRPYG